MKSPRSLTRALCSTTFLAAVTTLFTGCMSNIGTVKSTNASEIMPKTGQQAQSNAAALATAKAGPAKGKIDNRLQAVPLFPGPAQPVGIALSSTGRTFMSFPRWADPVKYTLVELKDGKLLPFPDAATNAFDGTKPNDYKPQEHLISVQAILFDKQDRLWVVDPGSFNFAPNILHGPKLWAYDINTGERVKEIAFPTDVALKMSCLNDVRIDLQRGAEGTAYLTDSGVGGIVIVDLATGESWRHLDRQVAVLPTPGLKQQTEGQPFMTRKMSGEIMAPDLRSDGIALSPDGKTLYFNAVASHDVWSIPTDLLMEKNPDAETKVAAGIKFVAGKTSGNDGMLCDDQGRIYTTDFEENAIRRIDPANNTNELLVQDARLLWPDTLCIHAGWLYITSNQLARQPNYHFGTDERKPPYALFRIQITH